MKTSKTEIKLKNGTVIPKGTEFEIKVEESNPTVAILSGVGYDTFRIRSLNLYKYFRGFIKPDLYAISEMSAMDGICPSLTGQDVEPDGWDEKGFPSMLIAAGYL